MPRSDTGTDWPTAEHEDQTFLANVEAVLAASRVLVGVAVRSLAPVENTVTLTQFRALVIMASRGPMHLAALANESPRRVRRLSQTVSPAGCWARW